MNPRVWIVITLILLVLATSLHIAGLVAPGWIFLRTSDFRVGVGLYFRIGCGASSGNNCTVPTFPTDLPFRYDDASTYDEPEWEAVMWLETIAGGFALVLCLMMIVYFIGFGFWRRMGLLNMAMTLLAVATWLVSIAGLIVYVIFYGDVITRSPDVSRESFPWSALAVFIAAFFFIIITILIRLRCRNRNYLQHAIPTSADSKMGLNPSTKSQVMKRYFTPTPYREDRRDGIATNPAILATDQSRMVLDDQQLNSLGHQGVEYAHSNGNLRLQNGWSEEARNVISSTIQTQQLRPGVSAVSVPHGYTQQNTFNTGAVTVTSDDRSRYRQGMLTYQQQQQEQAPQTLIHTQTTRTSGIQTRGNTLDDTEIDHLEPETFFYKGGGDMSARNLAFVQGVTTDQGQSGAGYSVNEEITYTNGGFAMEDMGRQVTTFRSRNLLTPPPPPSSRHERSSNISSYRIGAEHQDLEPFQELNTTHMRRVSSGANRVLSGAPLSNGDGFQYNRKFMYRPYSDQSY